MRIKGFPAAGLRVPCSALARKVCFAPVRSRQDLCAKLFAGSGWMKSAGNRSVVHGRLQALHVHVFLAAPLGACHMAQPRTGQHQSRVAIGKCPHHASPAADLTVQPLDHVVGADTRPVLAGKIAVSPVPLLFRILRVKRCEAERRKSRDRRGHGTFFRFMRQALRACLLNPSLYFRFWVFPDCTFLDISNYLLICNCVASIWGF